MGGYETTTIGRAFESSFDNPQWEAFETEKGERIVQFTGTISQNIHDSVITEITDQLSELDSGGNPEQQMIQKEAKFQIQLNYLQGAVEKLGGDNSAYFQEINKKFDCNLQFANLMGGVSAYIPDCKNDNSTAYMDAILNRRSIRKYKDIKISDEIVEDLLRAGMQAPSAVNEQPWEFIVIRNKYEIKQTVLHYLNITI
jgi:hypothetical protein